MQCPGAPPGTARQPGDASRSIPVQAGGGGDRPPHAAGRPVSGWPENQQRGSPLSAALEPIQGLQCQEPPAFLIQRPACKVQHPLGLCGARQLEGLESQLRGHALEAGQGLDVRPPLTAVLSRSRRPRLQLVLEVGGRTGSSQTQMLPQGLAGLEVLLQLLLQHRKVQVRARGGAARGRAAERGVHPPDLRQHERILLLDFPDADRPQPEDGHQLRLRSVPELGLLDRGPNVHHPDQSAVWGELEDAVLRRRMVHGHVRQLAAGGQGL
mmetsp:Transcript_60147/g.107333  ORF Transcript_60147/g.107333 Transcript_60147/m.107333 type:complete len:268 (-) Transcript_60147:272-1075(-)